MNYSLDLSADEVALIGSALSALPYRQVAGLMKNLQAQVTAQEEAAAAAKNAANGKDAGAAGESAETTH